MEKKKTISNHLHYFDSKNERTQPSMFKKHAFFVKDLHDSKRNNRIG